MTDLVGVILAAGEGTRLRPLTTLRPKPLCPVGNRPLLDLAIGRVRPHVVQVAVNAHYLADQVVDHLSGTDVIVSVEAPEVLGTAGALGALRDWIDGRDVLVHNADAWLSDPLDRLLDGWTGEHPRLLVQPAGRERPDFGDRRYVGASLLPAALAAALPARPHGLPEAVWDPAWERGELELVDAGGAAIDCGTLRDYLRANLCAAEGGNLVGPGSVVRGDLIRSVVGASCVVDGDVVRSVVWDGCAVHDGEHLMDAVRATENLTVHAQPPPAHAACA